MRYDQFTVLCGSQWADNWADVTAVNLTNLSLAELAAGVPPGVSATDLINPVTRSFVKVTGGGYADTAIVAYAAATATDSCQRTITIG